MPATAPQPLGQPRKFTRGEVQRMVDQGVLSADERCELLDGQLYTMSPQSPDHSNATTAIADALRAAYPSQCRFKQHSPLDCGVYDQPEPDVAVVRDSTFMAEKRHPRADETYLVVEVSKTSLDEDRAKASRYEGSGALVYWLVDLEGRCVEVYRAVNGTYQRDVLTGSAAIAVPHTAVMWTADYILTLAG